jgi:cellulose synthase/poly-beta-1,6-N-acetylglucosamine synthase-like glycosyltransferase
MPWLLLILAIPYIYILIRYLAGLKVLHPFNQNSQGNIRVTVIIPCRNEEKNIGRLLSVIALQDYPQTSYEVIVIDDNSTDHTFKVVSEFRGIKNLRIIRNEGSGKKSAIRTGISSSSGELILTTDADCHPGPSWIDTIAAYWSMSRPSLIIGPVALSGEKNFLYRFQEMEFLVLQGVTAGSAVKGNPLMCNGANLAFTKETYLANSMNLKDHLASGDDVFLLHSVKKNKGEILWLESMKALVSTEAAGNLRTLLRQRARWISKAGGYSDHATRLTAIVTFVTILLQLFTLMAGIFRFDYFILFLAVFIIKSAVEYLILVNRAGSYDKKVMPGYFIPAQFIYPFYVLTALFICLGRSLTYSAGGNMQQKW